MDFLCLRTTKLLISKLPFNELNPLILSAEFCIFRHAISKLTAFHLWLSAVYVVRSLFRKVALTRGIRSVHIQIIMKPHNDVINFAIEKGDINAQVVFSAVHILGVHE